MEQCRAILLDMGKTLWDFEQTRAEVWHGLLKELGVDVALDSVNVAVDKVFSTFGVTPGGGIEPHSPWEYFETSGIATDQIDIEGALEVLTQEFIRELGITVDLKPVWPKLKSHFHGTPKLYTETVEVLSWLRNSYRLAIVSNGVFQRETCRTLGVEHYFESIIGSWHVGLRKPMPEIFNLALSDLGLRPEETIMIGDSWENDVVGGNDAGIRSFQVVRDGSNHEHPDGLTDLWGLGNVLEIDV